jgi:hypothetical protein
MHAYIANTDIDWYRHFLAVGADDDINFWKPPSPELQPKRENLEYHYSSIFKA